MQDPSKQEELFLVLVDLAPHYLLELELSCVVLAEDQPDLVHLIFEAYNDEESLLFLVKEPLQPPQDFLDVHQLEIVECVILMEDLSDQIHLMLFAYNKEESPLFLADKQLLRSPQDFLDVHQLEIVECVILMEDLSDQIHPMLFAYNKEELLLFLADKQLLRSPQDLLFNPSEQSFLHNQLFLQLDDQPFFQQLECVILTEDQSDLDPRTLLAYNKEESPLFLVLLALAAPLLTLAPPTKTLLPKPLLPGE